MPRTIRLWESRREEMWASNIRPWGMSVSGSHCESWLETFHRVDLPGLPCFLHLALPFFSSLPVLLLTLSSLHPQKSQHEWQGLTLGRQPQPVPRTLVPREQWGLWQFSAHRRSAGSTWAEHILVSWQGGIASFQILCSSGPTPVVLEMKRAQGHGSLT